MLHEELTTKMYQHQGYRTFHVYDPKFRVINKATVRDRIVHHLVFRFRTNFSTWLHSPVVFLSKREGDTFGS